MLHTHIVVVLPPGLRVRLIDDRLGLQGEEHPLGHLTLLELSLPIMALGFTSMMFGLIISALVKTAEKTMPLLVMFAIIQVVFTGCLFALFLYRFGLHPATPVAWLLAAALVTITFIDLDHQIIPDVISLPGIPIGFLCAFAFPWVSWQSSLLGILLGKHVVQSQTAWTWGGQSGTAAGRGTALAERRASAERSQRCGDSA